MYPSLDQKLNREYTLSSGSKQYFSGAVSDAELALRKPPSESSAPGVVSSSAPVITQENETKTTVNQMSQPFDDTKIRAAYKTADDLLKEEYDRLEKQKEAEAQRIESEFAGIKSSTEGAQKRETGTFTTQLSRIGGYLGGSASHIGALQNLSQEHKAELATLESKKQAALNAARNAINEKQFNIARERAAEAKDLELKIEDRRNNFFETIQKEMTNKRVEENRVRDDSRTMLNSIISNFGGIEFEELSPEAQAGIEQLATTAGFPVDIIKGQMRTLKEQNLALAQQKREDAQTQRAFQNNIAQANLAIRDALAALSFKRFEESENLTALDAKRLELPASLVGMSENGVYQQLQGELPPPWFYELKYPDANYTPERAKKDWDEYRNRKLNPGSGQGGGYDYGSLNLPPPVE